MQDPTDYRVWHAPLRLYLTMAQEGRKDWEAGKECVARFSDTDWWEWPAGSRPHFWRWPGEYQKQIRDGVEPWLIGKTPSWRVPQRHERDPHTRAAMQRKLMKVRRLGYIQPGKVKSLTSYFSVPKGDIDIRMVYDGTKSGLNDAMWAPWFSLPTIEAHLRFVSHESFLGDIDVGDMFHNFMLSEEIQSYAGIDLTPFFWEEALEKETHTLWERWVRSAMGLRSSPYNTIQGMLFAEEVIRGDPGDSGNIFHWDSIRLNLPGSTDYDSTKPWVSKVRSGDGKIACDFLGYVDDLRSSGNSWAEARLASRRIASTLNWLGVQEAARKRRDPRQDPGPWAGSVIKIAEDGSVLVTVSQERWNKTREILKWIQAEMEESDTIDFKQLERSRGFLIYIARTFPMLTPYLKGIHLSLDSWRPWRRQDGWKMTISEIRAALEEKDEDLQITAVPGGKPPLRVKAVPRMRDDVRALLQLTSSATPPRRLIRPVKRATMAYAFADASGSGFGGSFLVGDEIRYISGQWIEEVSSQSSNFRELSNLINSLEVLLADETLKHAEVFMFTDNSTSEAAFFKGTSKSPLLFDLVLRLHDLQIKHEVVLHVVHVSGRRMIAQGTDGLSRGQTGEGVFRKGEFLDFVPLHLNAVERQPDGLEEWVNYWFGQGEKIHWLSPEGWFLEGQQLNRCVWVPPPAGADAALEQLAKANHKRPHNMHVVLIPRLMTALWRKLLSKICDLTFTVPVGSDVWNDSQCEPLVVGLCLPLSRHYPWKLKGTVLLDGVERVLRALPAADPGWGRSVLRQFLQRTRALEGLSASVVREVLQGAG